MSQRSKSYAWMGLVCLVLFVVGLVYMYVPGPAPEPACEDEDFCILEDAGVPDAVIHDAQVKFFVTPKNPRPDTCITADAYTYLESVKDGEIVLHSQSRNLLDSHTLTDIKELGEFVSEAWQRKFDLTDEAYLSYHDAVENLHIVFTDSPESFDAIVGENTGVAFVATDDLICFQSTNGSDFTMVLSPSAHKKLADPHGQYIIHELVHVMAKVATGNTDSAHVNTKLWIIHDDIRSVQAIAMRLSWLASENHVVD